MAELGHLLTDPAHWAFELITDATVGLVFAPVWAYMLRRHDRRKHGGKG